MSYKPVDNRGAPFGKETYGTMAAPSERIPVMSHAPIADVADPPAGGSHVGPTPTPTPSGPNYTRWAIIIAAVLLVLGITGIAIYAMW